MFDLDKFISEYESYLDPLKERYFEQSKLLTKQPELLLGLGLFESLIIGQNEFSANKTVDEILSNLI